MLNSNGYPASGGSVVEIWLTEGASYLFELKTSADVLVWSRDDIEAINDVSVSQDQWVTGPTPTYIGATSFSLVGDQTSTFHVGRRLKTTNTGGTIYSTITVSAYTSLTTITVVNDSGALDSGLSAVSYGLLSDTNHSIPSFQAKGDVLTQSAAGTIARLAVGSDGSIALARSAATTGLAYAAALNNAIYGLTCSNNGSDATNDIDIAAGGCMDSTNALFITCAAMTKKLDAGWAAGTDQGFRNSAAAITDTTYYIYAVSTASGTQDYYAHTSPVVATVLTALQAETGGSSYAYARRIGAILRESAAIVGFVQTGDEFLRKVPVAEWADNNPGTSAVAKTLKVPVGIAVQAILSFSVSDGSPSADTYALVTSPSQTDTAASSTVTDGRINAAAAGGFSVTKNILTSTAAAVRYRLSNSDGGVSTIGTTHGWIDSRGKDS